VNEIVLARAVSGLSHRRSMMTTINRYNEQFHVDDDHSSTDFTSTLLPMLVGGLGLIVLGMIAVAIFVG
jgi:hypothetical protein